MFNLSDLNELLEKIPVWKRLVALPKRVDELEERVRSLEAKLSRPLSKDACPACGERTFFLSESKPHPHMGIAGVLDRTFTCRTCGHSETFTEKPIR
ncbi:MAG: hypothetical protein RBR18_12155 [Desulfovibrionaceae bacterium]|nr:hypothetical protein [Desulfovibrionaceae bacterium]